MLPAEGAVGKQASVAEKKVQMTHPSLDCFSTWRGDFAADLLQVQQRSDHRHNF
jgi:hypothetical protein